ncbi:hypothetical protein GOODEAATRI_024697 [Goodea atripinnis]|uniref:Uncharacterized protein n=1 Tax=Goodea atripinnis TaxID=208336 RepID=A0ABV0P7J3_9TELE
MTGRCCSTAAGHQAVLRRSIKRSSILEDDVRLFLLNSLVIRPTFSSTLPQDYFLIVLIFSQISSLILAQIAFTDLLRLHPLDSRSEYLGCASVYQLAACLVVLLLLDLSRTPACPPTHALRPTRDTSEYQTSNCPPSDSDTLLR